MRIGAKKKPFYRVVAVDERSKRTGGYIELLGTYNPLTEPKDIKLNKERIDYWIKQGAQPSVGYLRIIGKAPQRVPRKAKKQEKDPVNPSSKEEVATPATEPEEKSAEPETTKTPEETPTKETAPEQENSSADEAVQTEEPKEEVKAEEAAPTPAEDEKPSEVEPEQSTEEK